jgi:hypothetical protein
MICRICQNKTELAFKAMVLGKHQVSYYHCPQCGFLQTEDPYWLGESYKDPINTADTGLLSRNISFSETTALLIFFLFNRNGKFLDYAGGFGIFTRLMRDIGFNFYWHDPMTQNLLAKGFEYTDPLPNFELLTSFESFEHFVDPVAEIQKMLAISDNILFSTFLLPSSVPATDWWYYQFEHGQHVSFYSKESLLYIAKEHGVHFYSHEYLHLFTKRKLPESSIRWFLRFKKIGLYHYVRRRMKSKIQEDFLKMLNSKKP